MSTKPERVHRKQNEGSSSSSEEENVSSDHSSASDEAEYSAPGKQRVNPFALLEGGGDDKGHKSSDEEDDSGDDADESADAGPSRSVEAVKNFHKTTKKKKRRGARAGKKF